MPIVSCSEWLGSLPDNRTLEVGLMYVDIALHNGQPWLTYELIIKQYDFFLTKTGGVSSITDYLCYLAVEMVMMCSDMCNRAVTPNHCLWCVVFDYMYLLQVSSDLSLGDMGGGGCIVTQMAVMSLYHVTTLICFRIVGLIIHD